MTETKQKMILERIYIAISLLFVAVFIFEVPGAVFFSPMLLFVAYTTYSLYLGREIRYSIGALLLILFMFVYVYFIYKPEEALYYQAYIHIHAVFMFIMGYNIFNDKTFEERKNIVENFFLFVSVAYIAYILITFWNYYYNTPADLIRRFYYSIWYHSITKPATVISMCLAFPLIYGCYALFYLPAVKKVIGAIFVGLTLFINIKTGTRTLVFLFPFLITLEFLAWLIFKKKKVKQAVIIFCVLAVVFTVTISLLYKYRFELREYFKGYSFARYFGGGNSTNYRIMYTMNVLNDFKLNYFGGGVHSLTLGTPHNIWLYIYDWGGIIPFVIYCVFTVVLIVDYIKLLKNKNLNFEFKALISTALVVIVVEFMMEPFILPLPSFYILDLFVLGAVSGFSRYGIKKEDKEKKKLNAE